MTPARRRPSCSCDGTAPPCAPRRRRRPPCCRCCRRITGLLPTQTRRSEESESLQQFSTPIGLAYVASVAAAITPADVVLEPSAGTGLLAILAELAGASLILNEFAESRAGILSAPFSRRLHDQVRRRAHQRPPRCRHRAQCRADEPAVLGGGPCRSPDGERRHCGTSASALARLPEGGRLVTITGANVAPDNPAWTDAFMRLQERGRVVFSAAIDGAVYAKHGTTIDTRLTVIDRVPADDSASFPASPGIAPDLPTLLGWVDASMCRRVARSRAPPMAAVPAIAGPSTPRTVRAYVAQRPPAAVGASSSISWRRTRL